MFWCKKNLYCFFFFERFAGNAFAQGGKRFLIVWGLYVHTVCAVRPLKVNLLLCFIEPYPWETSAPGLPRNQLLVLLRYFTMIDGYLLDIYGYLMTSYDICVKE